MDDFRAEFGERLTQDKVVQKMVALTPDGTLAEYLRAFRSVYKQLHVDRRDAVWVRYALLLASLRLCYPLFPRRS